MIFPLLGVVIFIMVRHAGALYRRMTQVDAISLCRVNVLQHPNQEAPFLPVFARLVHLLSFGGKANLCVFLKI